MKYVKRCVHKYTNSGGGGGGAVKVLCNTSD